MQMNHKTINNIHLENGQCELPIHADFTVTVYFNQTHRLHLIHKVQCYLPGAINIALLLPTESEC